MAGLGAQPPAAPEIEVVDARLAAGRGEEFSAARIVRPRSTAVSVLGPLVAQFPTHSACCWLMRGKHPCCKPFPVARHSRIEAVHGIYLTWTCASCSGRGRLRSLVWMTTSTCQ